MLPDICAGFRLRPFQDGVLLTRPGVAQALGMLRHVAGGWLAWVLWFDRPPQPIFSECGPIWPSPVEAAAAVQSFRSGDVQDVGSL